MNQLILSDFKESCGLEIISVCPVDGGWLNKKWKVSTGSGDYLVKQFSNKRYSGEKLQRVEAALLRQEEVNKMGVPCPSVKLWGGRAVRILDNDTAYMAMDFCPGKTETPDTITDKQMQSLGNACGLMHKAFARLPVDFVEGFPLDSGRFMNILRESCRENTALITTSSPPEFIKAVAAQEKITKSIPLDFFDKMPKGISHEDFAFDNILFNGVGVSTIIDFDRNHYSFIRHDIGRAILCFALNNDKLDFNKIAAFIEGYAVHLPLTPGDIADVLRLTWCCEAPWWIQPYYFEKDRGKTTRFRDEILWLSENWDNLDALTSM